MPALSERVSAVQALLRIASQLPDSRGTAAVLPPATCVFTPAESAGRRPGSYNGLRLLPGEALEAALPRLRMRLANEVVSNPTVHELRWLRVDGKPHPSQVRPPAQLRPPGATMAGRAPSTRSPSALEMTCQPGCCARGQSHGHASACDSMTAPS